MSTIRIGHGWDLHRLVVGKPLLLGGVSVKSPLGADAHSDGDVLLHALVDAILGAAALGDIGEHFPPTQAQWKDADSSTLLAKVLAILADERPGWQLGNVDATVILEKPSLKEYKPMIQKSLAKLLGLPLEQISVKAKTCEKLGPIGHGEAISALVTVLLCADTD
ncbi:MAG: 2-C-methyl-D-erythritol 2,4-cyclodiphosphate synthase [Candidatus Melainabacteria bacterium]|nr:2-C-methyl-D-erythritol 2,4-cyclodiphosphate synthase [Candidatus Melainabacteria bacterium]